jgi:hypothetical protein
MLLRMRRKRSSPTLLVGLQLIQPLWKSIWWFLRKLEIVLSEDPAVLLRGIYPKDAPPYHKDTYSTMFIAALFVIGRSSETT